MVHVQNFDDFDLFTTTFVSRARPNLLVRTVSANFRDYKGFDIRFIPEKPIDWASPDLISSEEEIDRLL